MPTNHHNAIQEQTMENILKFSFVNCVATNITVSNVLDQILNYLQNVSFKKRSQLITKSVLTC